MAAPTTTAVESPPSSFSIGVLFFPHYQYLDAAGPVDYINSHSKMMMEALGTPADILDKAPTFDWHYISSTGTLDPVVAASGPKQLPSATFTDCPPLDYLIVPGPDPRLQLSDACISFIQTRFVEIKGLLTICTGSMVLAQTGILDGVQVATNKFALRMLAEAKELNKKPKWVGDKRWVVDGKVWSSAGVTSGIDLAAEFARVHFDPAIVEMTKDIVEYTPNPAQPDPFARIMEGVVL